MTDENNYNDDVDVKTQAGAGISDEALHLLYSEQDGWLVDRADDEYDRGACTETEDDEANLDDFDPADDTDVADLVDRTEDLVSLFRRLGF